MKNYLILLFVFLSASIFISCDDQVEPKADFEQVYILNCILRGDTTYQIATLSKSYEIDGYDPYINKIDPAVYGAKLKIIYDNKEYLFRDTIISRSADSRYTTPLHYYYLKNFQPTETKTIELVAELPDGTILNSKSETFAINVIYFEDVVQRIPETGTQREAVFFTWKRLTGSTSNPNQYFAPELVISYTKEENGVNVPYTKKIPMFYMNSNTGSFPVYPSVQANTNRVGFDTLAINKALEEISFNDPNKNRYKIKHAIFRLLILDKNLAVYYAAQKTFLDEFSVRFSQPEFTNIKNGLGIFGTYSVKQKILAFDESFVTKFGYKIGN
jgi:hypothetical protein